MQIKLYVRTDHISKVFRQLLPWTKLIVPPAIITSRTVPRVVVVEDRAVGGSLEECLVEEEGQKVVAHLAPFIVSPEP